jgi:hypothetical protein
MQAGESERVPMMFTVWPLTGLPVSHGEQKSVQEHRRVRDFQRCSIAPVFNNTHGLY